MRSSPSGWGLPFLVAAGMVVVVGGCGVGTSTSKASPVEPGGSSTSPTGESAVVAEGSSTRLAATLSGDTEVPGPGDENGSGEAVVVLEPGRSEVCYDIRVDGVAEATAAHVHAASAGVSGDVVLGLDPPDDGSVAGCATADGMLLQQVANDPGAFYLNLHNEDHPDGALRGQLGVATEP